MWVVTVGLLVVGVCILIAGAIIAEAILRSGGRK